MVDIHSHILPEVDDGARSWEMAVHMCHMAAKDGIEHMVATPHANHEYAYDRVEFASLLDELGGQIEPKLSLSLGCDFHFSYENLESLIDHPENYTIGSTPYLLVELSDFAVPPGVSSKLQEIMDWGLRPILTHPERNPLLQRTPERVLRWVQHGCIVQVTASAFTGRWGKRAQDMAEWLLRHDAVHVLASDAHSINSRPPILSEGRDAAAQICGAQIANILVQQNPAAIVRGEPLPYFPAPRK
ncbi:MAG: tyrosine-protein phosphatase [Candidatus Korobacteraceae bacterium]